jgi:Beta-lactamase superfamily domain
MFDGVGGRHVVRSRAAIAIAGIAIAGVLLITGCGGAAAPTASTAAPAASIAAPAGTTAAAPSAHSPGPAASPATPAASGEALAPVPAGGVRITFEENAQVEILSPAGQRVLVDVADPGRLTTPATADDILLTTHIHDDHWNPLWANTFTGPMLTFETGTLTRNDVRITGIAAAHNQGDPFLPRDGSDYIFVVDVGGMRVVHFGDLGQDALTPEQMAAIGRVDVAISQLGNAISDVDATNRRGFNQMNQVHPAVLIPTHVDVEVDGIAVVKLAASTWKTTYTLAPSVTLTRDQLSAATTVLFMGLNAQVYAPIAKLEHSTW